MVCSEKLRRQGVAYPRTCADCGLGPCRADGSVLPNRKGDWMQMSSGRAYWPIDPRADEVFIDDIANALARLCRFGGHIREDIEFYCVAEHSVHVADAIYRDTNDKGLAFAGLMHDGTEAYVTDLIRPIKKSMPEYKRIEALNYAVIAQRFGLPQALPFVVKTYDERVLKDERAQVMAPSAEAWSTMNNSVEPLGVTLGCWRPFVARDKFLHRFYFYGGR